jgi:DNA-binding transcriptional regulator LsrR (DeoR family)
LVLTRQERERLALDLYYNQGKNTREIAKEVKMNFGDIGAIINKAREKEQVNTSRKDMVQVGDSYLTRIK